MKKSKNEKLKHLIEKFLTHHILDRWKKEILNTERTGRNFKKGGGSCIFLNRYNR